MFIIAKSYLRQAEFRFKLKKGTERVEWVV